MMATAKHASKNSFRKSMLPSSRTARPNVFTAESLKIYRAMAVVRLVCALGLALSARK
jgi:hypothetical protein